MLDKVHGWMTQAMLFTASKVDITDDVFKKLQVVMFMMSVAGIILVLASIIVTSVVMASVAILLIMIPIMWDRIQMFLISMDSDAS